MFRQKQESARRQSERRNKALVSVQKKSPIYVQHSSMLSHLNHSINSVELSDQIRMHPERKRTNVEYKPDRKKSTKKLGDRTGGRRGREGGWGTEEYAGERDS